jgi:hypothetical protein
MIRSFQALRLYGNIVEGIFRAYWFLMLTQAQIDYFLILFYPHWNKL